MDEDDRRSRGWDGKERRRNPVRRLLFAREVRAMMRELGSGERRFRRSGGEPPDDVEDGANGDDPHTP